MATNAYTSDLKEKARGILAPYILRAKVREYAIPKRQLIRLTYTHEKHPVRTVVLLQITSETFTVYKNNQDCRDKTGGTITKSLRAKSISIHVSKTNDSAIGSVSEMRTADSNVHHLHECKCGGYSYFHVLGEHRSAECMRLFCWTTEYGMDIFDNEDDPDEPSEAPYGLDASHQTFINDILFIDPKTKRIDTRAPMIDGWKMDIKYISYD